MGTQNHWKERWPSHAAAHNLLAIPRKEACDEGDFQLPKAQGGGRDTAATPFTDVGARDHANGDVSNTDVSSWAQRGHLTMHFQCWQQPVPE